MTTFASIDSFPNELLEKIFEAGSRIPIPFDPHYPNRHLFSRAPSLPHFQSAVSQVCVRWRNVATRMPALWTFLHLSRSLDSHRRLRSSLGRSLDWLPNYITRSAGLPLDITLDTTRLPARYAINALNAYSNRWRSFTLLVSHVGSLPEVLPFLVTQRVPRLQTLSIASDIYREGIICYEPLIPFLVNSSHLSTIRLTGVYIAWNELPLKNVLNLELLLTSRWPSFHQLSAMFDASPMLQRFVVRDDVNMILQHVQQPYSKPTVDLLQLKHMEIDVYRIRDEYADVAGFMRLFSMPSLETLTLKNIRQEEWFALTQIYHFPSESSSARLASGPTNDRRRYQRLRPSFPLLSKIDVQFSDRSLRPLSLRY